MYIFRKEGKKKLWDQFEAQTYDSLSIMDFLSVTILDISSVIW